ALAMAFVLGGAAWAGLNDGLIAYWSFDQCDATDDTGTGFNGTLYGNPSCEDGVEGKALFIDPVNDYIKFSGALGPNNIRAFSFFINGKGPNDLNRAGYVIGKYNWHGERSFRVESYRGDSSRIAVHFYERGDAYDGDGVSSYYEDPASLDPTKYTIINNTPLETNAWKHVVVNITNTEIEIWIDGQITNKVKRDYQQYFHSGEPVYIGNLFNIGPDFTFNYRLNGSLDEFRVYNRPLTEAEIQQLGGLDLSITTISVPATKLGDPFSFQFEALYGKPPYSWSISDGMLPDGMGLSSDGILSGTPTEAGEFTFTVRVTDDNVNFAEKEFTLDVLLTLPPPDIRITKTTTTPVPGR
ncbi:putative Ig domain-containing protein, partial [bacterium]|nr:putative Ig domain-containing protein [bacterium]